LQEIAFLEKTSIYAPYDKVKTKGVVKAYPTKFMRSTKRIPSYFKYVDFIHSQYNSCASKKCSERHIPQILPAQSIHLLNQFLVYILDVVDVKVDDHCGYRVIAAELGMGEELWTVV